MYNWLTRTRQGQIVSFLVVLFLIGSYVGIFQANKQKKPPEPAPPVPAPSSEAPAELPAPVPKTEPAPMNLEKLISELTSFYKTQVAIARDQLTELRKPTVKKAKIEGVWIIIQIKDPSLLQEAAKEILSEIEKDKLAQPDDVPKAAGPAETIQAYERISAERKEAAKKLRKAKAELQTAARATHLTRSESWRQRTLELRAEVEAGEKALAELDKQARDAKAKIPEPPL